MDVQANIDPTVFRPPDLLRSNLLMLDRLSQLIDIHLGELFLKILEVVRIISFLASLLWLSKSLRRSQRIINFLLATVWRWIWPMSSIEFGQKSEGVKLIVLLFERCVPACLQGLGIWLLKCIESESHGLYLALHLDRSVIDLHGSVIFHSQEFKIFGFSLFKFSLDLIFKISKLGLDLLLIL